MQFIIHIPVTIIMIILYSTFLYACYAFYWNAWGNTLSLLDELPSCIHTHKSEIYITP